MPTVELLRGDLVVARWEVPGECDLGMVDELARTQVAAKRMGYDLRLLGANRRLLDLLELLGLSATIAVVP